MYITLLAVRQRNSDMAFISHKKIVSRSGIQPIRVRAAIDVLINHRLIDVSMAQSEEHGRFHNTYCLLGFRNRPAVSTTNVTVPPIAVISDPSFLSVGGQSNPAEPPF